MDNEPMIKNRPVGDKRSRGNDWINRALRRASRSSRTTPISTVKSVLPKMSSVPGEYTYIETTGPSMEQSGLETLDGQDGASNVISTTSVSSPSGTCLLDSLTRERQKKLFRSKPARSLEYLVQPTDTLAKIALGCGSTLGELMSLNHLTSQMIFPGQMLYIPDRQVVPDPMATESLQDLVVTIPGLAVPGHIERVQPPVSAADKDLSVLLEVLNSVEAGTDAFSDLTTENYMCLSAKYITDGIGIVSGVLLATRQSFMFKPSLDDRLVQSRGASAYTRQVPVQGIAKLTFYGDSRSLVTGDSSGELIPSSIDPGDETGSDCTDSETGIESGDTALGPAGRRKVSVLWNSPGTPTKQLLRRPQSSTCLDDLATCTNLLNQLTVVANPAVQRSVFYQRSISYTDSTPVERAPCTKSSSVDPVSTVESLDIQLNPDAVLFPSIDVKKSLRKLAVFKKAKGRSKRKSSDLFFSNTQATGRNDPSLGQLLSEESRLWMAERGIEFSSRQEPNISIDVAVENQDVSTLSGEDGGAEELATVFFAVQISPSHWCPELRTTVVTGMPQNRDIRRREYWFMLSGSKGLGLSDFLAMAKPDLAVQSEVRPDSNQDIELLDMDYIDSSFFDDSLPPMLEKSNIMEKEHLLQLCRSFPSRAVGHCLNMVYSTSLHGISLRTLYRNCLEYDCPGLMLIKEENNMVFGAILSDPPRLSEGFYGNGECALFTFLDDSKLKMFTWTGDNSFFLKGNVDSFCIGGGDGSFGLWLNEDLYIGRSQRCLTFANDALFPGGDFRCQLLELWLFV